MTDYVKPFKTFEEQLDILKGRGLQVSDDQRALHYLRSVGLYTLGGYLYSMRRIEGGVRTDDFLPGASFDHLIALYDFDRALRRLCLDALEVIERSIKVRLAHNIGQADPFGHHNGSVLAPDAFRPRDDGQSSHERWLAELDRKSKRPGNDAIQSFIKKYGNELPVWVATEAMDFGDASRLIGLLDQSMLSRVARPYDLQSGPQMNSWTRAMCGVRNIAAHHERLWNRRINDAPMKPKGKEARHFKELERASQETWGRPYATLLVIAYFLDRIQRTGDWSHALGRHLTTLPIGPGVDAAAMGAPADWKSNPLWGF